MNRSRKKSLAEHGPSPSSSPFRGDRKKVPITEDTDLEALALSQNKRFWKVIDDAIARGKKDGFVDLSEL